MTTIERGLRKLGCVASSVAMMLVISCSIAVASDIPLVDGTHWMKSTDDVKKAYLVGVSNVIQLEVAYQAANSIKIGNLAKEAVKSDVVAPTITQLRARQIELIKSIPTEAAERVHSLALEQSIGGRRAEEIQEEIARTGEVTTNRAKLIARTEVARSNSVINATRAKSIGATHYVWETMEDAAVRPSHEDMAGNIYAYDDPPEVDGEGNHGPGDFPNCRCFANPVLDNV